MPEGSTLELAYATKSICPLKNLYSKGCILFFSFFSLFPFSFSASSNIVPLPEFRKLFLRELDGQVFILPAILLWVKKKPFWRNRNNFSLHRPSLMVSACNPYRCFHPVYPFVLSIYRHTWWISAGPTQMSAYQNSLSQFLAACGLVMMLKPSLSVTCCLFIRF